MSGAKSLNKPIDMAVLTDAELAELRDLAIRQKEAWSVGDFIISDKLRAHLMEWGAWPPDRGWWPALEENAHYRERYLKREKDAA